MAQESQYFQHDYDPTSDLAMAAFIHKYKAAGYGIFWRVTELLHKEKSHRLPLNIFTYVAIAKDLSDHADLVKEAIEDMYKQFFLLETDGDFIWSNRVNRNINNRKELSVKRSAAGRLGAIAKQTLANAKQNVAKERKGKEIKVKEKGDKVFTPPTLEEVKAFFSEKGYTEDSAIKAYDYYSASNWIDSKKNQVNNWKQKMISVWFKPENKISGQQLEIVHNSFMKRI